MLCDFGFDCTCPAGGWKRRWGGVMMCECESLASRSHCQQVEGKCTDYRDSGQFSDNNWPPFESHWWIESQLKLESTNGWWSEIVGSLEKRNKNKSPHNDGHKLKPTHFPLDLDIAYTTHSSIGDCFPVNCKKKAERETWRSNNYSRNNVQMKVNYSAFVRCKFLEWIPKGLLTGSDWLESGKNRLENKSC